MVVAPPHTASARLFEMLAVDRILTICGTRQVAVDRCCEGDIAAASG